MNNDGIDLALQNLEVGLRKYEAILHKIHNTDISTDMEFQKAYNGFFRMRQRTPEFYATYFSLFESLKTQSPSFSDILVELYQKTNRIEASFSSKMLSMIDPNYPIWDKFVLQNLGLKAPYPSTKNRIEKTILVYDDIIMRYEVFMNTNECADMLYKFNTQYPNTFISDVKKIDLILWQLR